ncbi:MAG: hypothetical protein ACREOQ_08690 [Gemmatimonadales bacterium]
MSVRAIAASLAAIALPVACGHRSLPPPAAQIGRDPGCPDSQTVARQDSGIDLGRDVSRRPRYRVDSAGRVETLAPPPAAGSATAKPGCPSTADSSSGTRPP